MTKIVQWEVLRLSVITMEIGTENGITAIQLHTIQYRLQVVQWQVVLITTPHCMIIDLFMNIQLLCQPLLGVSNPKKIYFGSVETHHYHGLPHHQRLEHFIPPKRNGN